MAVAMAWSGVISLGNLSKHNPRKAQGSGWATSCASLGNSLWAPEPPRGLSWQGEWCGPKGRRQERRRRARGTRGEMLGALRKGGEGPKYHTHASLCRTDAGQVVWRTTFLPLEFTRSESPRRLECGPLAAAGEAA